MRTSHLAVALLASLLSIQNAFAHVFWIRPSTYHPQPGALVKIQFRVGDNLPGDAVPRDDDRVVRFISSGPTGEEPIAGRDGADPAGIARFKERGSVVLAYHSTPAFVRLEAQKFEEYLRLEGLEKIIERRAAAGTSQEPAREHYTRCAKAIVSVGGQPAPGFDRVIGLPLELIPETDPASLTPGASMTLRLVRDAKPLAGALVRLMNVEKADARISARTDERGRVTLQLSEPGTWIANAVDMTASASKDADWESLWASLSFEITPTEPTK